MKKKYLKISRNDEPFNSYIIKREELENNLDGELDAFPFLDVGTTILIQVVEMEESEFENLPEFQGW